MKLEEIQNLIVLSDDVPEGTTIKEYLKLLLSTVWEEEEGFSGKRPFGNSGWQYDIYATLAKNDIINGDFDEETIKVDNIILKIIDSF